jgi:hypothetical protein
VQAILGGQHKAAGLPRHDTAADPDRQAIHLMLTPGRVETLQGRLEDIEPPDPVGDRTPEAGFAQRIVRFDHAGDFGHDGLS